MMRVVITVASLDPGFGGPPAVAFSLAGALRAYGVSTEVVGCGNWVGEMEAEALPTVRSFHGTPVPRELRPLLRAVSQADLVHSQGLRDPVGTTAALWARARGIPYLVEPCGMHRRRLRSLRLKRAYDATLGRVVMSGAAAVIATSSLERQELIEDGVVPERIRLRPNGVALDGLIPLPRRGSFRSQHGIPEGAPVVLHLGRITSKKGLTDLARALTFLPEAHGVVAGPDDGDGTVASLDSFRREEGLEARLHILPRGFWGREKAQVFADADCFALPSATENFGVAAAEAAACGLPVVVSDACGVAEFLDPEASRVVPHGDVEVLAEALSELLSNGARRTAEASAPRLQEALDWGALAQRQVQIYREAVRRKP